jgi:phospholipase C
MAETDTRRMTRRQLIGTGAAGAGALSAAALLGDPFVQAALAAQPRCGRLQDIEHVVILVQENRSFDHYFGSYRGVAGFQDPDASPGIFSQHGYPAAGFGGVLEPFHIDTANGGECTNDINHSWGPQHTYWNGGRLDSFVSGHVAVDGAATGALAMGYYKRADLEFYYALADAFTICDHYHSSVIGPTDPNRLYTVSATLGPDGSRGGPILSTSTTRLERFGSLSWTTMPEQLDAHDVSWKVYSTPDGNFADNVLPYFKQYQSNPALAARALVPTFPGTFELDCALGHLPAVSWVLAPLVLSEHPPLPIEWGQYASAQVLKALTGNPALWAKTALFITFDENGGFFDHVPPPVAESGTPGEYLTQTTLPADASGVRGPIGLGFRVPMLIASPFARGGFVCSDTFDHTSTLRFLETRFGAEVPNLSAWRRSVTGDLTSAFNFVAPDGSVPALPKPSLLDPRVLTGSCLVGAPVGLLEDVNSTLEGLVTTLLPNNYPVPPNAGIPPQEPGTARAPSGPATACSPRASRKRRARRS